MRLRYNEAMHLDGTRDQTLKWVWVAIARYVILFLPLEDFFSKMVDCAFV